MPIVKPRVEGNNPETRALEAMQRGPAAIPPDFTSQPLYDLADDRTVLQRAQDFNNSILETTADPNNLVSAHLRRSGVVSSLMTENLTHRFQGIDVDQMPDPNFNPYDLLDDKFAEKYPYLVEHFEDGSVLDIPNEDAFWHWAGRVEDDYNDRQKMAEYGFFTNIVASVPSLAIDSFTAGAALRVFGLAGQAAKYEEWIRRGSWLSRSTKAGVTAGALNLGQEELLRLNNPDRNVEEGEAAAMAFGFGVAFGAAVPALGAAKNKAGVVVADAQLKRAKRETLEYFAHPNAKTAEELIANSRTELQRMLDSGDSRASVTTVINDETRPLIDELGKKYPGIEVVEHPDQGIVDWYDTLRRLDKSVNDAITAKGTNTFSTKYAEVMSSMSPASRTRYSSSSLARRVARNWFDDTTATVDSVERPLTNTTHQPAEARKWSYETKLIELHMNLEKKLTDGLIGGERMDYTFANGERITIGRKDPAAYQRAVVDYARRVESARRHRVAPPDAPEAIRKGADDLFEYERFFAREAVSVGLLPEAVLKNDLHIQQRWKAWEIQRNAADFQGRLYNQFLKNRELDFNTKRPLTEADRPVLDDVIDFGRKTRDAQRGLTDVERKQITELIERYKEIDPEKALTEAELRADLGDDVMRRYLEEVDLYLQGAAESTRMTLSGFENSHGVTQAMTGTNAFKRRMLEIDHEDFAPYLVEDLQSLVGGYHREVSGKIAVRKAIQSDTQLVADLKALGVDLEAANYDPSLLIDAIRKDFDDQMYVARGAGDMKRVDKIEKEQLSVLNVLQNKLDELQGVPAFGNSPATWAGWKLAQKVLLRLPTTAFLGKVGITSLTDLTMQVFTRGLTPRHIRTTVRSMNLLKSVPDYGLEALYIANNDAIRSSRALNTFDLDNLGEMRSYGPGRKGQAYEAIDRTTEAMTNTFFKLTGMNRWNQNQKRTAATIVIFEFMRGAKKMAQAQRLLRTGMSEADAIAKVGLSPEDARLLNRLGINGKRSERLMQVIAEHGRAFDLKDGVKKPWANQAEFEQFLEGKKGYVSPEFYSWWEQDRDLFDTLTGAVNRHVQDLIVEPKLLSKPLINNSWFGRVFNQFQSFAFAWGNQHAHLAAQRPVYEQINSLLLGLGLSAIVDAIHNQLSGRRSFEETADAWADNPASMMYGAFNRSQFTGPLARFIGLAEQTPIGPGRMLGNTELSGTYSRPISPLGFVAGPLGSLVDQSVIALMQSAYEGEINDKRKRQLWNALPYHNLWFIEGALRAAESMGVETPNFTRPRSRQ